MKIWFGYGSEHSMNLVMVGHFREAEDAAKALDMLERIKEQANIDQESDLLGYEGKTDRFSDGMRDLLLYSLNITTLGPADLEQFLYDVNVRVDEDNVVVTTDEVDVSAFLKVLIRNGARVEIYSAHDYRNSAYGR